MRPPDCRAARTSGERWLVSYADFITLLFAFFVVLFASAYRDTQAMARLAAAIHNGFQTLGAFPGKRERIVPQELPAPISASAQKSFEGAPPGSPADLLALRHELQGAMGTELKSHEVDLRVTPEGFVISLQELGFFNSGQAVLLPGAAVKIQRISNILSRHELDLRVEGHSDDQPIHNAQFRDNWELSTARAMTVVLLMVDQSGYDPHRISVAGYAQYRPVADNTTAQGRSKNRRVDLVVLGRAKSQ